jgi:hypothetical protein
MWLIFEVFKTVDMKMSSECDVVWLADKYRRSRETCCLRNNFSSTKKQVRLKCRYMPTRLLGVNFEG